MGIEPTSKAWEAFILPLNYTRPQGAQLQFCPAGDRIAYKFFRGLRRGGYAVEKNRRTKILLNGSEKILDTAPSVASLLQELGLADKRVAVEINCEIVPRSQHAGRILSDNDRVEVVVAIGGG